MKRIIMLSTMVLCLVTVTFGQTENAKVEKSLIGVYFIPLKVSYEHGIGNSNTVELSIGVTGETRFENDVVDFYLVPYAALAVKNFYNLERRQEKGKNTTMNSGNFWGLSIKYGYKPINSTIDYGFGSIFIAPMWGIQRNYKSHFSLGLALGVGPVITSDRTYISPKINLKLGFILFSKS